MSTEAAIYVHIPFCKKKCPYCAFYKTFWDPEKETQFLEALTKELSHYQSHKPNIKGQTLFLGGGTPSLLSPKTLAALIKQVTTHFHLPDTAEKTIEMNPETVTQNQLDTLKAAGINRISLGVQSFNAKELQFLGRTHQTDTIEKAISLIQQNGFKNVNLDVIFALPNSTLDTLSNTIEKALSYQPTHLSTYNLTIEKNTPFHKRGIQNLDSDIERTQFEFIQRKLKQAGYHHYEVSNFAKPGYECQHNLVYWHLDPYIGIGPSACSFLEQCHYQQTSDLSSYINDPTPPLFKPGFNRNTSQSTLIKDYIMTHLRLAEGVSLNQFNQRFGRDALTLFKDPLKPLIKAGYLTKDLTHLKSTRDGFFVIDGVISELISTPALAAIT